MSATITRLPTLTVIRETVAEMAAGYEARLAAANKIIALQNAALVQARMALCQAQEVIESNLLIEPEDYESAFAEEAIIKALAVIEGRAS